MTDQDLKITDKRMFTPEGELREEYRHLEDAERPAAKPPEDREEGRESPPEAAPPRVEKPRSPTGDAPSTPGAGSPVDSARPPTGRTGGSGATFQDLVGLLAQNAAITLGDAPLPDGQSTLDLRAAQMYIDLLDVLQEKTRGNLDEREEKLLEELLYQLRLVYVEKSREPS